MNTVTYKPALSAMLAPPVQRRSKCREHLPTSSHARLPEASPWKPPDADSRNGLAADILAFQAGYAVMAKPFEWKFTRTDLAKLLRRLASTDAPEVPEAA